MIWRAVRRLAGPPSPQSLPAPQPVPRGGAPVQLIVLLATFERLLSVPVLV